MISFSSLCMIERTCELMDLPINNIYKSYVHEDKDERNTAKEKSLHTTVNIDFFPANFFFYILDCKCIKQRYNHVFKLINITHPIYVDFFL